MNGVIADEEPREEATLSLIKIEAESSCHLPSKGVNYGGFYCVGGAIWLFLRVRFQSVDKICLIRTSEIKS